MWAVSSLWPYLVAGGSVAPSITRMVHMATGGAITNMSSIVHAAGGVRVERVLVLGVDHPEELPDRLSRAPGLRAQARQPRGQRAFTAPFALLEQRGDPGRLRRRGRPRLRRRGLRSQGVGRADQIGRAHV